MELKEAVLHRHSVRGFLPRAVPRETVEHILSLGTRAMSANNSQPWQFVVVSGEPLEALREANLQDLAAGRAPDRLIYHLNEAMQKRAGTLQGQIYAEMEIGQEDIGARKAWAARGFSFFDAPLLLLLCMDADLEESSFRFDMGCVTQLICLAAGEYGLGCCVEEQALVYQRGLREVLALPSSLRPVAAIAMGYPDPAFPANGVVSQREPVEELTQWLGFSKA